MLIYYIVGVINHPKKLITYSFILSGILILCFGCKPEGTHPVKEGWFNGAEGSRIYYQVHGNGTDTLVIIHGGPGAGLHSFSPSVEPLSEYFTLIQFDQRGGGASSLPENKDLLKPEYYVTDLDSLRSFFNLNHMKVIAHSFGAILIAEYLTKHPESVDKLFLHAATGPNRAQAATYYQRLAQQATISVDTALTNKANQLFRNLIQGSSKHASEDCYNYERLTKEIAVLKGDTVNYKGTTCKGTDEAVGYYYQYTAQLAPSFYGAWDYTNKLIDVETDVRVGFGQKDSLGLEQQLGWTHSFPNAELISVPDASKGVLSDNPSFIIPKIISFFKENE